MPDSTYTQTAGTPDGQKYFHDVAISPATLASGALAKRLNPRNYPKVGRRTIPDVTIASVTPATGAQGATLDVVIAGTRFDEGTTVSFSGTGITVSDKRVSDDGDEITVTLAIAGGATADARNLTVTNSDGGTVTSTGAFTVTV